MLCSSIVTAEILGPTPRLLSYRYNPFSLGADGIPQSQSWAWSFTGPTAPTVARTGDVPFANCAT